MSIANIKAKLKEDFSFIKNDGKVLDYLVKELLSENNNELQKTLDFIDTLCKKDLQTRITRIIKELETAGEISLIIKDEIKKDNDKLDKLKQSLKSLKIQINEFEDKKLKLKDIKYTYDEFYTNGYDNDFDYHECEYIRKIPVIHIDVDKILKDLLANNCNIYNINKDMFLSFNEYETKTWPIKEKTKIKLNYPAITSLQENEHIIKVYIIKDISYTTYDNKINTNIDRKPDTIYSKINIIYLSNYGRLIKSNDLLLSNENQHLVSSFPGGGRSERNEKYIKMNTYIIYNNLLSILTNDLIRINESISHTEYIGLTINKNNNSINTISPKLNFLMPRIFIEVIDAFHTQNTELMQDCCKKYLCITRKLTFEQAYNKIELESVINDKQSIIDEQNILINKQTTFIKSLEIQLEENNTYITNKDTIINEKDLMIKTQNEIIEKQKEEIEKMKLEITKLKSALLVFTN